jgi:hypothetical protein
MVKQIAPVVSFVLLAACGAVCQNHAYSLPDAPSARAATHERKQRLNGFGAFRPAFESGATASRWAMARPSEFAAPGLAEANQPSSTIFFKYLRPSSTAQTSGHHPMSGGSLMGRATYAASRPLITRDYSGKSKLNTSYLLRTLTAVARDTASTPYWKRSRAEPFSDFGSTIGNDAGMNLWHEFGPSIEQLLKTHTPKFVARIEERIGL